jgi:hypothetical protein
MQDQRIEDDECGRQSEARQDKSVLLEMMCGPSYPWTVEELARELQNPNDVEDAVRRLTQAGLLHRFGDFVFPTRACRRADELKMGII